MYSFISVVYAVLTSFVFKAILFIFLIKVYICEFVLLFFVVFPLRIPMNPPFKQMSPPNCC